MDTQWLTTQAAAERLGLSPSALAKWRMIGEGPAFLKLGAAVRYSLADINAWAETRRRRSTSESGEAA